MPEMGNQDEISKQISYDAGAKPVFRQKEMG